MTAFIGRVFNLLVFVCSQICLQGSFSPSKWLPREPNGREGCSLALCQQTTMKSKTKLAEQTGERYVTTASCSPEKRMTGTRCLRHYSKLLILSPKLGELCQESSALGG